jgi:uncharacterized alpha-E superfamily protein
MTRGHAWRFLDIGRRLERAINVVASIRAVLATDPAGSAALPPLLEYTDSTMTYRRRHLARPELPGTLHLLLADEGNPRSLAFQCRTLAGHLEQLPGDGPRPEREKFREISNLLAGADVLALAERARRGETALLEGRLKAITEGCWELSDLLSAAYFSHVTPRLS